MQGEKNIIYLKKETSTILIFVILPFFSLVRTLVKLPNSNRTPLCVTLVRTSSSDQQIVYGEASSQTFNAMHETQ